MTEILSCALVGLGGMGEHHARRIRDTPGWGLAAVCDPVPDLAARAAEHAPGAACFADFDDMLARVRPGLVVVATPHHLHAPVTVAALSAGAHVLVEKPMATTEEDAATMIEAARSTGRVLTVYHNRRNDPGYLTARRIVDDGMLGNLVDVHCTWLGASGPESWRGHKHESGGLFYDLGSHLVDYLLGLVRKPVVSVAGQIFRLPGKDPALNEDHAVATLRFEGGIIGRVTTSALDRAPVPRFRVVGDRAVLVEDWEWPHGAAKVYTRRKGGPPELKEFPHHSNGRDTGRLFYDNLAEHLRSGAPLLVQPTEAARIMRVFRLAERSAAAGGMPQPF
jgi:predicted dehydrogenase